jgi:Fe2+ or Zn2+ uptake regulation protein
MPIKKLEGSSQENTHCHHIHCNGKSFQKIANETLKSVNFKITKPRLAVINCLETAKKPLSPKNIFEQIKQKNESKIDQVSVYRVLESLTQLGLVHQIYPSGDYVSCHTSCEKKPSHILLNCSKCNETLEMQLEWNFIESIFEKIKISAKFNPIGHMMQINGICVECQSN